MLLGLLSFAAFHNSATVFGSDHISVPGNSPVVRDECKAELPHRVLSNSIRGADVIPADLPETIERHRSDPTLSPNLLDRFPTDEYAKSLMDRNLRYKQIPDEMREWSRTIEREFGSNTVERYHQLLLLELMKRFEEISSSKSIVHPNSVMTPIRTFFASILRQIGEPLEGNFVHGKSGFDKDLGVCSLCLTPCGAQLLDRRAGVSRKSIYAVGVKQSINFLKFMSAIGGFQPLYEMHMDVRRLLLEFNPSGWTKCYHRIAELMEGDPRIKGVFGNSWWFDPHLASVSPRLAFLHQFPTQHGARLFHVGSDETSTQDAIRNSPERQELFEQGKYVPRKYLMVWGRVELLAWKSACGV